MKQIRKWVVTLSLAGLALAALVYVFSMPEAQVEASETGEYKQCVYVNIPRVPTLARAWMKGKTLPIDPSQLDEFAIRIPTGWTPVGGGGGSNGVVLCR